MMPGTTIIRRCSTCGKLIEEPTIVSGNTFGARFWTDGKMEAPMLPDEPWLVKCWHCGTLVWISELEQVEDGTPWVDGNPGVAGARPYDKASFADYLAVLGKGGLDNRKEKYLRLRAWWAGNDKRRGKAQATPLSEKETVNLMAYVILLDGMDEDDRLTKAEVLRELGAYDKTVEFLTKPFGTQLAQAASIITKLAAQKVSTVRQITFS